MRKVVKWKYKTEMRRQSKIYFIHPKVVKAVKNEHDKHEQLVLAQPGVLTVRV